MLLVWTPVFLVLSTLRLQQQSNADQSCPTYPFREGRRTLRMLDKTKRDVIPRNEKRIESQRYMSQLPSLFRLYHTALQYRGVKFDFKVERVNSKLPVITGIGSIEENRKSENWSKYTWYLRGSSSCSLEKVREYNRRYNLRYNVLTNNCQNYTTKLMMFLRRCRC
ncbi:uncharacterized protein LOC134180552 [Corticium candelabrum]|uniref:uncharacterized protein LOC134180552 n=1 Tax=Corticium candelabrum TaxID=121492 RepID=UPI002E269FD5|nr:uncharacterized protein LOC134180552 [Corticium candelabrum]